MDNSYKMYFKRLEVGKPSVIDHDMGYFPLVDVYQLDYFQVVESEDGEQRVAWTNFYLYYSGEQTIRHGGKAYRIEDKGVAFSIKLEDMLAKLGVHVEEDDTISKVENQLWQAINTGTGNDAFDDDQHSRSVWFDGCCREDKTVAKLKREGSWDELMVQMRPRKTINLVNETDNNPNRPNQVQVSQHNFDTISLTLVASPIYSKAENDAANQDTSAPLKELMTDQIPVLVILKV